jgi:hypothetical protein
MPFLIFVFVYILSFLPAHSHVAHPATSNTATDTANAGSGGGGGGGCGGGGGGEGVTGFHLDHAGGVRRAKEGWRGSLDLPLLSSRSSEQSMGQSETKCSGSSAFGEGSDSDSGSGGSSGGRHDKKANVLGYGTGTGSYPGCVSGVAVFRAADAMALSKEGQSVIWFRGHCGVADISRGLEGRDGSGSQMHGDTSLTGMSTQQEDVCLSAVCGLVTERAGVFSSVHLKTLDLKLCALTDTFLCELFIDEQEACVWRHGVVCIRKHQVVSIDTASGLILDGEVPMILAGTDWDFTRLMRWCDEYKSMNIFANADTVSEISLAIACGADGIGLCRSEQMFDTEEKRDMTERKESRASLLEKMSAYLKSQYRLIFREVCGRCLAVRLLDVSMNAFLPHPSEEANVRALADRLALTYTQCLALLQKKRREVNRGMGCKGCRTSMLVPELMEMETTAIIGAYSSSSYD